MDKMGKTKEYYAKRNQLDKFRELREKSKTSYRKRTGSGLYVNKAPYTPYEDEEILKQKVSDIELAKLLCRSATSIQIRRCRLKRGRLDKYVRE